VERLKAFCSLSDYFGDACFAALNQKNSTSLTLGTQTAFDFHPLPADLTCRFSKRLFPKILEFRSQKPFNLSRFDRYSWDTTLKWFKNLRLGSRARRKPMKKRSIHASM
jgi:hypothetical protein